VVAGCSTTKTETARVKGTGKYLTVRTTAYTHTEPGGIKNAIGSRLKYGDGYYSAASDWSWLPLGTRFRMVDSGRTYVIEDYGSALVGRKTIDLYVPNMREVNRWGVRHKEIEILEWGSKAMSLKLLAPRARNRHVAVMVAQLRRDGVTPPG
jgi:3D (Asp-Asp-Asp) domain-containing protein